MRPLVFVHGQRFADGGSGLAQRTRLAFDALTEWAAGRPRYLVTPDYPAVRELAVATGWQIYPVSSWIERRAAPIRLLLRLGLFWSSLRFTAARSRLLAMLGGADMPLMPVSRLLQGLPGADIWLSRCDLLHLVEAARSDQRITLDANDTVANLVRCYDPRARVRRLSGLRLSTVVALVAGEEKRLAARCSRIVAISPEDKAFYRTVAGADVQLEESCSVTPDISPGKPLYDVGFLGGAHMGSVAAAKNFLRIASMPALAGRSFVVAGGVCAGLAGERPGAARIIGRVPSSAQFFSSCRQVVFWSDGETGTSVKFQEAVLSGTTVLANATAARWSKAKAGRDFILCESEADLVRTILDMKYVAPSPLRAICTRDAVHSRFAALAEHNVVALPRSPL